MASYEIPGTEPDPKTLNTGDSLLVKSAGTATEYTVAGGEMKVNGKAVTTTLNSGKMYVYGQATNTTMAGGTLYMKGGTINTLTMTGGTLTMSAGTANAVEVKGGSFKINSASCVANNSVVNGGTMIVYNGTASLTQVKAGTMNVSGGTVNGTTVTGGGFHVYGGNVTNTNLNGGVATIHTNGTADGVTVNFGGKLVVSGQATDVVENGGYVEGANVTYVANTFSGVTVTNGSATIHAATTAENLSVGAKGHVYLYGGTLTGTLRFTGGDINVKENSTLNFDLSLANSSTPLFDSLSADRFSFDTDKTLNCTIKVNDGKTESGTYLLAKNAGLAGTDNLTFTLINEGTGWTTKTITVGETIDPDTDEDLQSSYTLKKNSYGTLFLTVKGGGEEMVLNTAGENDFRNLGLPDYTTETFDGTTKGGYSLTIKKGTFINIVNCGDRLTVSDTSIYHRSGTLQTVIEGGSFQKSVAGGMMHDAGEGAGTILQDGDVLLSIKGGTFQKNAYIFAGNISKKKSASTAEQSVINGNVDLVLDTSSSALSFQQAVYAGSYGKGTITGNVTATLTGNRNVTIANDLWGACSSDTYYEGPGEEGKVGRREFYTNILGSRTLSFEGFNGKLSAGNIGGFDTLVCTDSNFTLGSTKSKKVALGDIKYWNIAYGSSITGAFGNNFYDDTLVLGSSTDTLVGTWTVMDNSYTENSYNFEAFNAFESVMLFGEGASYDSGTQAWVSSSYQLSIDETKTKMQVSAINIA